MFCTERCRSESGMASASSARPCASPSLRHQQSEQSRADWDVFLSHSGVQKGFARDLYKTLYPPYNVFFDVDRFSLPLGEPFPDHIKHAANTCKVGLVVLSNDFFCSKWAMLELCAFFHAGVYVLPLFYELSPKDLSDEEKHKQWEKRWEEFASKDKRFKVDSCVLARKMLRSINGLVFDRSDGELAYLDEIWSAINERIRPLFKSSHDGVQGRDRLCKIFVDKFEHLEKRSRNLSTDPYSVYLLGVYGLPGSGKTTLCGCLRDYFTSSFNGKALHLNLPIDPAPTQLLESAKRLLKLTNLGHNREVMISAIETLPELFDMLRASDLRSSRVFLAIDNIFSQESSELVEAILQLGVGAGSRVMLATRSRKILGPLLNSAVKRCTQVHYVCGEMRVRSLTKAEAICVLLQPAGWLGSASDYGQKMEEKDSSNQREIVAKAASLCDFSDGTSLLFPFYLPLALKIIGTQLRSNGIDSKMWNGQLLQLNTILVEEKENAVKKIVEGSYKNLPDEQKFLFLDVSLFLIPYLRESLVNSYIDGLQLLGFMHACSPYTILRRMEDLVRLCFLEEDSYIPHDLFLEFAKTLPDASSMYYCGRRKIECNQVMSDLSQMAHRSSLRALILEVDEECKRFDFPVGFSGLKAVVVRNCKSLEVLGLTGLDSLVSLTVEGCPRLRYADFDHNHRYTIKSVRWEARGARNDQPPHLNFQKRLLQMLPAERFTNWVCSSMLALGGWHLKPASSGFVNLASQLKALQVLHLENTGIRSLRDVSSCWPQLRELNVLEPRLEALELGKLLYLKEFVYEDGNYSPRRIGDPRMPREPKLLAGCPELENLSISNPSHDDGMGTLILPPKLCSLTLRNIFHGEPVLPDFTSSAHLLQEMIVRGHHVLQNIGFTHQFSRLAHIQLNCCPNLVRITGLEWLPRLQILNIANCAKLQFLGNVEALRTLKMLQLDYCPVLTLFSLAQSSERLIAVKGCPNVQFSVNDIENLTALRWVECNVFGSQLNLKNLEKFEMLALEWKREGQCNNALSLSNYDDEAMHEQVSGYIAREQRMQYWSFGGAWNELDISGVQSVVSLDGIHCLRKLSVLTLEYLPNLACLQGLESLIELEDLKITECSAIKVLPSLCSLVKLDRLVVTDCVNLISVEGIHEMKSLETAIFCECENLEHLEPGPSIRFLEVRGCKLASKSAMVRCVLDEEVLYFHFRVTTANCIIEADPDDLHMWISRLLWFYLQLREPNIRRFSRAATLLNDLLNALLRWQQPPASRNSTSIART